MNAHFRRQIFNLCFIRENLWLMKFEISREEIKKRNWFYPIPL
jgi:hypothetical protein